MQHDRAPITEPSGLNQAEKNMEAYPQETIFKSESKNKRETDKIIKLGKKIPSNRNVCNNPTWEPITESVTATGDRTEETESNLSPEEIAEIE